VSTVDYIRSRITEEAEDPRLGGYGPPEWSTNGELALSPETICDPNGYYKQLGFRWPFKNVTRLTLRKAYLARNGQSDRRMTYAFKKLLDPAYRAWYDRLGLCEIDIADPWVWEGILRQAARVAAYRSASTGRVIGKDVILEDLGIEFDRVGEESPEIKREDLSDPLVTVDESWSWGFYLLRSTCSDKERLERWQGMLLAAARRLGLRARLCMGFVGQSSQEMITGRFGGQYVIFLHEDTEPSEGLAIEAIASVKMMINTN
jgi:hypothetical protein